MRVVVPFKLRNKVLCELHKGHCGIVRKKALARSYVWWVGLDDDIANMVKDVQSVKQCNIYPLRLLFILGLGPQLHGREFM